jgi:protein-L-isoaspartate(D-aspartate) O-methyltransferase
MRNAVPVRVNRPSPCRGTAARCAQRKAALHLPPPGPRVEPDGPLLTLYGGGGGSAQEQMGIWLWPLPPPGPLTLVTAWPAVSGFARTCPTPSTVNARDATTDSPRVGKADATPTNDEAMARNDAMVDSVFSDGKAGGPIVQAFRSVLRHWFLPDTPLAEVYRDRAIPTRLGPQGPISSSSQPTIMARMLDQLDVEPGQRILEIGAGTGYNAALLAHLVGPNGSVVTVDIDPDITADAQAHLATAGADNVTVITGDGWAGAAEHGPFDRIQSTVGVWDLAPAWIHQLQPRGVIVVPLWLRAGLQASVAFDKENSRLVSRSVEPCGFMRLRGPGAGPEHYHQIGAWMVCLDDDDRNTIGLVAELLQQGPASQTAPPLNPGWFTAIALTDPDAINLFSLPDGTPVSRAGLLDRPTRTLAVVETDGLVGCGTTSTIHAFGGDHAVTRLLDLIDRLPAVDLTGLTINALPASDDLAPDRSSIATLTRPHLRFVITTVA